MNQKLKNALADIEDLASMLKNSFVAKDELVEMMVTSAIAQEHLLIVGPPGTAKSELVKRFALLCSPSGETESNGVIPYFEYLLTRFTEPNEIFGPVNIHSFKEGGGHRRETKGMLPQAEIAFLDEVFKSNSAILNALLTVLNERLFYNGGLPQPVPLLFAIGATNEIPQDASLGALYDRFLVRVWTDNVPDTHFANLYRRGWELEKNRIQQGYKLKLGNITTTDKLRLLYRTLDEVKIEKVAPPYREAVRRIRAEGIALSDRRVVKLLKLVAASALRRGSKDPNPGDFWVLKHVWRQPDQIPHLESIVNYYTKDFQDQQQFSAERELSIIEGNIERLNGRLKNLKTEADFADFLQQANRLRHELAQHSDEQGRRPLLKRLETLIEQAMQVLETVV